MTKFLARAKRKGRRKLDREKKSQERGKENAENIDGNRGRERFFSLLITSAPNF